MSDLARLARLDATAQADLVRRGELSASEAIESAHARLHRLNPLLHAVVTVTEEPPPQSAKGPLAGVPFLVKDVMPWPGLRWSMGSRLFATNVANQHTPYGKRLAEAGLFCLGKTATSEFGLLGSTETLLEGITHNPWHLATSAAGSSGGSAAAVAAGIVPLAHGNDGGGSLRIPASVCGLFGFKPSRGRTVPAALASSDFIDMTSDHCLSRSVRDSALFLSLTEDKTANNQVGFVREASSRRLRIGTFTGTAMGEEPDSAVREAYDDAVRLLMELGHRVEPIAPPAFDGPKYREAFFQVAGAAMAGVLSSIDSMRGTPVQHDELEPFTWSLIEAFEAAGPNALISARQTFETCVQAYRRAVQGFDVVLTPTLATVAWPIGHLSPVLGREELIARTARTVGYTPIHNVAGAPAMSVPLYFPEHGAPIGMQFSAAPGEEAMLLSLAYELEAARPWQDRWPPYSIPSLF